MPVYELILPDGSKKYTVAKENESRQVVRLRMLRSVLSKVRQAKAMFERHFISLGSSRSASMLDAVEKQLKEEISDTEKYWGYDPGRDD